MSGINHVADLNADTWDLCDSLWVFGQFFGDWYHCPVPPPDRKFRLLLVAAVRAVGEYLLDPRSRTAVDAAEQYADSTDATVLPDQVATAAESAYEEAEELPESVGAEIRKVAAAAWDLTDPELTDDRVAPLWVKLLTLNLERVGSATRPQSAAAVYHLRLFHDIFRNPFRPVPFDPAWRTAPAGGIAQTMYESRDFGAMPILADALEDAGCDNPDVLAHCRGPGPHVRGCWMIDLVLDRS